MRGRLVQLIHRNRERKHLRHKKDKGEITPEEAVRLDELTDRLLDDLIDEVADLSRDVDSAKAEARRHRF